jgi:hypothetical protein
MTVRLAREETRCAMSTEEANRLLARSNRWLRKVKEWLAYFELMLTQMYLIRDRLELAEQVAAELRIRIKRDKP